MKVARNKQTKPRRARAQSHSAQLNRMNRGRRKKRLTVRVNFVETVGEHRGGRSLLQFLRGTTVSKDGAVEVVGRRERCQRKLA